VSFLPFPHSRQRHSVFLFLPHVSPSFILCIFPLSPPRATVLYRVPRPVSQCQSVGGFLLPNAFLTRHAKFRLVACNIVQDGRSSAIRFPENVHYFGHSWSCPFNPQASFSHKHRLFLLCLRYKEQRPLRRSIMSSSHLRPH